MSHSGPGDERIPLLADGRFEMKERIAGGGMGTVYRAVQTSVGRTVAIKVLSPEQARDASGLNRFVREANVISRLQHPNIVSLIDFGRDSQGNMLLVMELLEGETLRGALKRGGGRLPLTRALSVALQILSALRVAHAAGVVHRDLKPENVFLCRVDGADVVKVLDFGVAKLVDHQGENDTTVGAIVGTLRYMSPEQISGDPPDARVDLYATGTLLFEMLAGRPPFDQKDRLRLLRAILNDDPPLLSQLNPELPPELVAAVHRSLAKSPHERFDSADAMRAALQDAVRGSQDSALHRLALPTGQVQAPPPSATLPPPGSNVSVSGPLPVTPSGVYPAGPNPSGVSNPSGAGPVHNSGVQFAPGVAAHNSGVQSIPYGLAATSVPPPGWPTGESSAAGPLSGPVGARPAGTPLWPFALLGLLVMGALAAGGGVLLASRGRGEHNATAPTGPSMSITVETQPPGALLIDNETQQVLCESTPCAVPVLLARPRRVILRHGSARLSAVLDASMGARQRIELPASPGDPAASPPPAAPPPEVAAPTPVAVPAAPPPPPRVPSGVRTGPRVPRGTPPPPSGSGGSGIPIFGAPQ